VIGKGRDRDNWEGIGRERIGKGRDTEGRGEMGKVRDRARKAWEREEIEIGKG